MSRLPDEAASHRQSAQHNNRRPKSPWHPRRLDVTQHVAKSRRTLAALLCALGTAAGLARLLWAPSPKVVMKQRPRAPLAAVHIVYTYDADCDDDMRGACQTSIEALLDNELPGVPRRSFASLPGAVGAYRAALEAIASGRDEGYVLVLVPDEDEDDVLAEVYPLLHAAFGERLRGFDHISAGCLPQNCGPRTLAVPPPMARGWPPAPAEEWCFEVYYGQPRGPLVAYADMSTGLFTREGAQRYLDAFRPGDFVLTNAPAQCVACSLHEEEWMCKLRENAVASERQLRRLRFPPVPRVTLYQVFRRPVPADIVAQNLANIPIPVRYSFIYDGEDLRRYFVEHSDPRLLPLFDSLKFVAWKVDLWRYCRLYESGGLYLDADALLLRPLSTEAFEHDCIFVYDPVGKNVWNGLLYARRPGNPILKAVIEFMIEAGPSWGGVRAHHFHYNIDFLWAEVKRHFGLPADLIERRGVEGAWAPAVSLRAPSTLSCYMITGRYEKYATVDGARVIEYKNRRYPYDPVQGLEAAAAARTQHRRYPYDPVQGLEAAAAARTQHNVLAPWTPVHPKDWGFPGDRT